MKKLIAIVFGSVLLVGCGPQPPNYGAFIKDVDEVTMFDYSSEPAEMADTAVYLCVQARIAGKEPTIELIKMGFFVDDEDAARLFESLNDNVCSKLRKEDYDKL